jgi:hypothetical protein
VSEPPPGSWPLLVMVMVMLMQMVIVLMAKVIVMHRSHWPATCAPSTKYLPTSTSLHSQPLQCLLSSPHPLLDLHCRCFCDRPSRRGFPGAAALMVVCSENEHQHLNTVQQKNSGEKQLVPNLNLLLLLLSLATRYCATSIFKHTLYCLHLAVASVMRYFVEIMIMALRFGFCLSILDSR